MFRQGLHQVVGISSTSLMIVGQAWRTPFGNFLKNLLKRKLEVLRQVEIGYIVDPSFVNAVLEKRAGDRIPSESEVSRARRLVQAEVEEITLHMNIIYRAQMSMFLNKCYYRTFS